VRLDETLFNLLVAGYVPILTHPERLSWIKDNYALMRGLAERGVWMQITAGSLVGRFGKGPAYWAERMLAEGIVHILATDAHDLARRPPDLAEGRERAARLVGAAEAEHLVITRPMGVLADLDPAEMVLPEGNRSTEHASRRAKRGAGVGSDDSDSRATAGISGAVRGLGRRLRQLLD
jgi:protein-tyrosine phosphatase